MSVSAFPTLFKRREPPPPRPTPCPVPVCGSPRFWHPSPEGGLGLFCPTCCFYDGVPAPEMAADAVVRCECGCPIEQSTFGGCVRYFCPECAMSPAF